MLSLTVPPDTCAALLNVDKTVLSASLDAGQIRVVSIGDQRRVSLFEIARLLGTSADELLDYLEDFALADAIEEVEADVTYTPTEGRSVYKRFLSGETG